jgi:hypothetical protein
MEKKEINILIPHMSGAEELARRIVTLGLNKKNPYDILVKIGTNFRIIDLNKDNLFDCINYYFGFTKDIFKEFSEFSGNEKFDYIVLDANEIEDYGIENFPTEDFLKSILKENGQLIIEYSTDYKNEGKEVKIKYENISHKITTNNDFIEIPNYILGEITKILEKK